MTRAARVAPTLAALGLLATLLGCGARTAGEPVNVGLIAPLSGGSAASGEAIQRGITLAIDEVNATGGVLGRPLRLVVRDVQNDPRAGLAALQDLLDSEHIVAVFGGIFSPVMLAQLDLVHARHVPLISPWGSVTEITQNGRTPNYVFRVSVSDAYADEFLVRYARTAVGARAPGIIADTTAWGDSNVKGLTEWLRKDGLAPSAVERFQQGDTNMIAQVTRLMDAKSDALLLIANAPEGAAIIRSMAAVGWKVPVISHWGISGGQFVETAGVANADGVFTLQTYSFQGKQSPKAEQLIAAYHAAFKTRNVDDIRSPVGVAHGYDGMRLLARAINQAGSTDGALIRAALEDLAPYDGLVKRYAPAFTAERHDALLAEDYVMTVWQAGVLMPAVVSRLAR